MLLLDEVFDNIASKPPGGIETFRRQIRAIKIKTDAMAAAYDLADRTKLRTMERLARFVCWPDHDCWIESERDTDGRRFAASFHGAGQDEARSTTEGSGNIILDELGKELIILPILYDLANYKITIDHETVGSSYYSGKLNKSLADPIYASRTMGPLVSAVKPVIFALLALINSPKIIRTREVDVSRLNARRLKKGKYPFHEHHEITINIDKHTGSITRGLGDGPERAQHFVRAHPRYLVHPRYKNVEVVMVPPHYRGNPALGMRNTQYTVATEKSK